MILKYLKNYLFDFLYLITGLLFQNSIISKASKVTILATGPSLNKWNKIKHKDEIVIGVNGVVEDESIIHLVDYLVIEDKKAYRNYKNKLSNVNCKIILPIDLSLKKSIIKIPFVRLIGIKLYGNYLSDLYFTWGGTVVFLALQIANKMGANEIHLCGVDMYVKKTHYRNNYYAKNKEWNQPNVNKMIESMEWILKVFIKKGKKITSESDFFNYTGVNSK